ncbi:MAG: hypothetical protein JO305_00895 [Alphaproteobacteria bacterium]|nr:hypothetical protein [Alphaproteobacteria bacterium]
MSKLFCICLVAAAFAIALPGDAPAQSAFDGIYAGVSATLSGTMSERRSNACPQTFVPAPLTISGGRVQTSWGQQPMDGTVTPQGQVGMHSSLSGRLDAQIDPQGTVRGSYSGFCIYTVVWQKRR